jgi:hypothetical protein
LEPLGFGDRYYRLFMKSRFKRTIQDFFLKKKKKIQKCLAFFYLVSTKNRTATFVDYKTKQILLAYHRLCKKGTNAEFSVSKEDRFAKVIVYYVFIIIF